GSMGDVALAAGNGVPPPGWWFAPGSPQQQAGAWMALASATAAHRTKPMFVLSGPFSPQGRYGWSAALPSGLEELTDHDDARDRSPLLLFENGCPLGAGHHLQQSIFTQGRGRYSFWKGCVFFSTSDDSDPNVNGFIYEVRATLSAVR